MILIGLKCVNDVFVVVNFRISLNPNYLKKIGYLTNSICIYMKTSYSQRK